MLEILKGRGGNYSNLSSCNDMLFLVDQIITVLRSFCSIAISRLADMALIILVSSVKHLRILFEIQSSMSLMNIRNKIGPRTVP